MKVASLRRDLQSSPRKYAFLNQDPNGLPRVCVQLSIPDIVPDTVDFLKLNASSTTLKHISRTSTSFPDVLGARLADGSIRLEDGL